MVPHPRGHPTRSQPRDGAVGPARPVSPGDLAARRWPLTGRGEAFGAVTSAIAGSGRRSYVLGGGPGMGRSRLALEVAEWAASAGFAVETFVVTRAAASVPFGAFARLLQGVAVGSSDRLGLFIAAIDALEKRARGGRLVFVVDDAHLLDQASAAFLHQVAATGTAFVVATVRTGEPAPEPVVALGQAELGSRLELPPLTLDDVDRLLGAVLDGPVDRATLDGLARSTCGNLGFLRELIAVGRESEALTRGDGIWRWTSPLGTHPRVVAMVDSHLGRLTPPERELVELLAAGEPLELSLLERLVPGRALESVERTGLLQVDHDGRRAGVRLAHPIQGEVIRATAPPVRVRALQRQLAAALAATGLRRRGDLVRHSVWRLDAGEPVERDDLLAAAQAAASRADHRLAERLARAAQAAGHDDDAGRLLAGALIRQGRLDEAASLLAASANPSGADSDAVTVFLTGAIDLYLAMGVAAGAGDALDRARTALGRADRARRAVAASAALCDVVLAVQALTTGRPADALAAADAVLRAPAADEPVRLRAQVVVAMALAMAGRTKPALETVELAAGLGARTAAGVPERSLPLLAASAVAHRHAGHLVESEALAAAGYRQTVLEGNDILRPFWSVLLGRLALDRGRIQTATRWFREGTSLARAVLPGGQLPWCLANLSIALAQAGDAAAAETAVGEAEEVSRRAGPSLDCDLILARAWTAAAGGETSRAVKLALEAGDLARERGRLSFAASAVHDAVRLGGADRALPRLRDLVPALDGRGAPVLLAHATSLAVGDGPGLDTVSVAFEEMGAVLLAGEAATAAAVAHRRLGKLASALAAGDRARLLQDRCEGARTPGLERLEQDVLTRREREVAVLAAGGRSNREIADLLVVSVRTIENQLHRVYAKLGLAGRDQLAVALGRPRS